LCGKSLIPFLVKLYLILVCICNIPSIFNAYIIFFAHIIFYLICFYQMKKHFCYFPYVFLRVFHLHFHIFCNFLDHHRLWKIFSRQICQILRAKTKKVMYKITSQSSWNFSIHDLLRARSSNESNWRKGIRVCRRT